MKPEEIKTEDELVAEIKQRVLELNKLIDISNQSNNKLIVEISSVAPDKIVGKSPRKLQKSPNLKLKVQCSIIV